MPTTPNEDHSDDLDAVTTSEEPTLNQIHFQFQPIHDIEFQPIHIQPIHIEFQPIQMPKFVLELEKIFQIQKDFKQHLIMPKESAFDKILKDILNKESFALDKEQKIVVVEHPSSSSSPTPRRWKDEWHAEQPGASLAEIEFQSLSERDDKSRI